MNYTTGETLHFQFVTVSGTTNTPLTAGTTFDDTLYYNGSAYTDIATSIELSDASSGVYSASFTPIVSGNYQMYIKNNLNNVIFVTGLIKVSDSDQTNIYVGL